MALGTITCHTNRATMDAVVATCGLRATQGAMEFEFTITSSTRDFEPEVEEELFQLALARLKVATDMGALPDWTLTN